MSSRRGRRRGSARSASTRRRRSSARGAACRPCPRPSPIALGELDVAEVEAAALADPKPRAVEQLEHGVVASSSAVASRAVAAPSSAPLGAARRLEELRRARRRRAPAAGAPCRDGADEPTRRVGRDRARAGARRRSSGAAPRPCGRSCAARSRASRDRRDSDAAAAGRPRPGPSTPPRSAQVDERLEVAPVGAHRRGRATEPSDATNASIVPAHRRIVAIGARSRRTAHRPIGA